LTEEKSESKDVGEAPKPIPMPNQSSRGAPTSPATDDLGLKIASVKNVWESLPAMPTVFEHRYSSLINPIYTTRVT